MEDKPLECDSLPEGCIASILSRTTPIDTFKFSLVSTAFYHASQSDIVWNNFLPDDYTSIISRSVSDISFISNSPSKKSIFQALSNRHILIDNSTKSFQLDKKSGKKCYMLGSRALTFCGDFENLHWSGINMPESRFLEVFVLHSVRKIIIKGEINTKELSPNTHYAAYLVLKMNNFEEFRDYRMLFFLFSLGVTTNKREIYLNPCDEEGIKKMCEEMQDFQLPNERSDGWLEIEIGNFFNSTIQEEVYMLIHCQKDSIWESGLIIEGIEVRPKDIN